MDLNLNFIGQAIAASYTSLEKQAIYQTLCGAMRMDEKIDESEIQVLNQVKSAIQITEMEIVASRTRSVEEQIGILRQMDSVKKNYFMKFLATICLADNHADPREIAFVDWISQEIGAPELS